MKGLFRHFREVGKRNSQADMKRIQDAHDRTVDLGAACKAPLGEAFRMVEAEVLRVDASFNARMEALRIAARSLFTDANDPYNPPYVFIRDCFDQDVVVQVGDSVYAIPYVVGVDGDDVTLGAPVEVDVAYVPAADPAGGDAIVENTKSLKRSAKTQPVSEAATSVDIAGEFVALREAAVAEDGSGQIKIIAPGWGTSGYYSPALLKRDGPKVFKEGLQMFWDHQTPAEEEERSENTLRNLAAKLSGDARWQEAGPEGPGLYAPMEVYKGFREDVNDMAADIGVSIRASGTYSPGEAEGRTGRIIESIARAKSIDFVTAPGAGGKILQLFEAARGRNKTTPAGAEMETTKAVPAAEAALIERITGVEKQNADLLRVIALQEASMHIDRKLVGVELPAASIARLRVHLTTNAPPLKEGRVDVDALNKIVEAAVKAEAEYVAVLTESGKVRGVGAAPTKDEQTALAEAAKSLEQSFADLGLSVSAAKAAAAGRR